MPDFDLQRFVSAQAAVFDRVMTELQAARKSSHWMWFVFPQLRGLGNSDMARHYGIVSLAEARAYAEHMVLGPRLARCSDAVLAARDHSLHAIFGSPDDLKFGSCMTLFEAATHDPRFTQAIERCCRGVRDSRTLLLLAAHQG